METTVKYNSFNTAIEKAEISTDEENRFSFYVEQDEETLVNKLVIDAKNDLTVEAISLSMTLEEVKQFNLLISKFLRQL